MASATSCSSDFDTTRRAPPEATLGDDVYTTLCDRLGATVLTEDLSGVSYRGMCHRDIDGTYEDSVDESALPPVSGTAAIARRRAVGAMTALARRREDLIAAINATFDDGELEIPFSSGDTIRNRDALFEMLQKLVPLHESNPVEADQPHATGEPITAGLTRATGRLMAGFAGPGRWDEPPLSETERMQREALALEAQRSLASISGRQGYRPLRVALGAIRPALAYPGLRELAQTLAPRFGPGGDWHDSLQLVLSNTENELATSQSVALPPAYRVDAVTLQPNRPRTKVEIGRALMLSANPAFAAAGAEPRFIVRRDMRGVAVPVGSTPGVPGTLSGPFTDADGDGFADVDDFGRFMASGGLVEVDPPFVVPGWARVAPADTFGRAVLGGGVAYEYVNTSETLAAAVVRDLKPLLDPDPVADNEAVMDLLSGAHVLFGPAKDNAADFGTYPSFDASQSPLVDLLHATGQLLAHPRSDVWLKLLRRVVVEHEPEVARVLGAALRMREVANQYDFTLEPDNVFWDEMMQWITKLVRNRDLFRAVVRTLRNEDNVTKLGNALANFSRFRDKLSYNPDDINGPPLNITTGTGSLPVTEVDRTLPDTPEAQGPGTFDNRSVLHQTFHAIHAMTGVNACNRQGAKVVVDLPILPALEWPLIGSYDECELFDFRNIGAVYLDSILGKAELVIKDNLLDGLINGPLGGLVSIEDVFRDSSGIEGMSLTPGPRPFNRLVLFGAVSDKFDPWYGGQMPDRDPFVNGKNEKTNNFVEKLIDPLSTLSCPTRTTPQEPALEIADCDDGVGGDPTKLLRITHRGVVFNWENFEFLESMEPLVRAFDDYGEKEMILDLLDILYRHWPTNVQRNDCNGGGTSDRSLPRCGPNPAPGEACFNPDYCTGGGLSRYEPIMAETLGGDIMPALSALVTVIDDMGTVRDERRGGVDVPTLDVLAEVADVMFNDRPDGYAASVGMAYRDGGTIGVWADGRTNCRACDNTQVDGHATPFDLFARAMRNIDVALEGNPRRDRWRHARSRLVDSFLAVNGSGAGAQFRNPSTPAAMPILIDVLREQVNANCPDRETNPQPCAWATTEFASKARDTIEEPTFSTTMHLVDLINEDEAVRRVVERFLQYLLDQASTNDALRSTLASLSDVLQVLGDDRNMPAIYNAVATASAPKAATIDGAPAPGAIDRVLQFVQAMTAEPVVGGQPTLNEYDPYRALDRILINIVTPIDGSDPDSPTPIEIFLDTIAEVNRVEPGEATNAPLSAEDYAVVFGAVRDFLLSDTRGLEQFYVIVREKRVQ